MTDISWTIETKDNGTINVPRALGDTLPPFNVGDECSIQFALDSTTSTAYTVLEQYAIYLNSATTSTGRDIQGEPWFHESQNPRASFASSLILCEAGADVGITNSWWAVITDAELVTDSTGGNHRITLELFVIGTQSEHNSRSTVEDRFESTL